MNVVDQTDSLYSSKVKMIVRLGALARSSDTDLSQRYNAALHLDCRTDANVDLGRLGSSLFSDYKRYGGGGGGWGGGMHLLPSVGIQS